MSLLEIAELLRVLQNHMLLFDLRFFGYRKTVLCNKFLYMTVAN